jgi:hypothetical protein
VNYQSYLNGDFIMLKLSVIYTLLLLSFLTLSCQKKDEAKTATQANWIQPFVFQRNSGGQVIPTTLLFDCRTLDSTGIYYYFQIIGNTQDLTAPVTVGNIIKTKILNSELIIAMVSSNAEKSDVVNYLQLPIDLYTSQKSNGTKKYILNANAETVARISENYFENTNLMSLKTPPAENPNDDSHSRILTINAQGSLRLHEGGIDLPGLSINSAVECKSETVKKLPL